MQKQGECEKDDKNALWEDTTLKSGGKGNVSLLFCVSNVKDTLCLQMYNFTVDVLIHKRDLKLKRHAEDEWKSEFVIKCVTQLRTKSEHLRQQKQICCDKVTASACTFQHSSESLRGKEMIYFDKNKQNIPRV